MLDERGKLILRKNGVCLPLQLGEVTRHERRVFQETGHLGRLGQVTAGVCRLGGPEKPGRGISGCVTPAQDGVKVVRGKDMPVAGQVPEMDEVVPDPVA